MKITKSDFNSYLSCPANFWMSKKRPELFQGGGEMDSFAEQLIEQGREVEIWARKLIAKGKYINTWREEAVKDTLEAIQKGEAILYEAAFEADGLYARIDILEKTKKGWNIYEIKGSSAKDAPKEAHLWDAIFQREVMQRVGYKIDKIFLIELNSEFRKNGEIDPAALLVVNDITEELKSMNEEIRQEINLAKKTLRKRKQPTACDCILSSRRNHCASFDIFYPNFPDYAVHDLTRVSKKKLSEFYNMDVQRLEDIPDDYQLTTNQENQLDTFLNDSIIIDKEGIKNHLSQLEYPIYFLDYETSPSAVPIHDGCKPYQQVPFQYSLHIQESPGAEYRHKEYLQPDDSSPFKSMAEKLCKDIGTKGSVVVWNKGFEKSCNKSLAETNKSLRLRIEDINDRLYDLMEIFSKQHYVHADFHGSASIKKVLPVLCKELSYSELSISNGGAAFAGWKEMVFGDVSAKEKEQRRVDLLEYCELDTWAMVRILEEVRKMI